MQNIRGIIPPILTPMREDESIYEGELRRQVNRLIDAGVQGVFALGTNGEGFILSPAEKEAVLAITINEAKGRVPVYAGTGCISTKETISMSKKAYDMGADVLSIITPWFAQASQEELYGHYYAVAAEVDLPIVLYNIPARTGNALAPETVARLAEIDNIVGVKDSSGDWNNMRAYIDHTKGSGFAVLSGNDALILKTLEAGGVGGISGCANVFPRNMVEIYEAFMAGDMARAQVCQNNIESFRGCFRYGNPNTIVKAATALLGYAVGKCRAPFAQLPDEGIEALRAVLEDNAVKGIC